VRITYVERDGCRARHIAVHAADRRNIPTASHDDDYAAIFRELAPAATLLPMARAVVVRTLKATARTRSEDAAFDATLVGIDPDLGFTSAKHQGHCGTIHRGIRKRDYSGRDRLA
jgi:hypothetical protein